MDRRRRSRTDCLKRSTLESGGAKFWFHALRNCFLTVAERELMLPRSLTKRLVNHARPSDVTEATQQTGPSSSSVSLCRIPDWIDALMTANVDTERGVAHSTLASNLYVHYFGRFFGEGYDHALWLASSASRWHPDTTAPPPSGPRPVPDSWYTPPDPPKPGCFGHWALAKIIPLSVVRPSGTQPLSSSRRRRCNRGESARA